jgi:tripartite ATP-independent transporter DctM subunit
MTDINQDARAGNGARTFIDQTLGALATLALIIMMGHVVANIFFRSVWRSPLPQTFELVGHWYLPLIALTGFVWAELRGSHIQTDLVYNLLPKRFKKDLDILGAAIALAVSAAFCWHTGIEAADMAAKKTTAMASDLIIWPVGLVVPVAFAALVLLYLRKLLRIVKTPESGEKIWVFRAILALVLAGLALAIFTAQTKLAIAVWCNVLLLTLLFLRVQVAFALSLSGLLGLWLIRPRAVVTELEHAPYEAISNWSLSVIPMFVFMGLLLWKSGLTAKIYEVASAWVKWLTGGLAVSTTVAGTGLAAVSGSPLGTIYALSRIGIPEMLKSGYDRRIAVGSVMVAGLPGQLIPPSTLLVIYSGIAEVPIGPQLMAGILPGLMISAVFVLAIIALGLFAPKMVDTSGTATESLTFGQKLRHLASIWPIPVLIGVVIGGMYGGILTATEAGAAGALGALLLTLWRKKSEAWDAITSAALETVAVTGAIFLLLIGAEILTDLLSLSAVTRGFTNWVATAEMERITLLLLIFAAYLVMGMFMEPLPIMILTVPLLLPALQQVGVSPLWFGVFVVLVAELAMLTPPVGILSFIVHGIVGDPEVNMGQDISLRDIFTAVAWFMPIAALGGLILILVPELATWLPSTM